MRLLKAFSEEQVEIGISDLAKRLGVAKSTVHRLAVTLVADGMLEQNPDTGKYRLGIALFRLGSLVRRRMTMSNEARPLLRDLREKVNETVHLAVLDGSEIMYVFNLESTQAIRMRSDVGVRKPAYCTAEGQAILAFQPADVVERVVRDGLAARTPQTITDPQTLRKVLDGVRARGCAIEDEESELGMRCIAAPLRNDARRGGGGDRARRAGEPAVEEGARDLHPARDRDRRGDLGAARLPGADRGVMGTLVFVDVLATGALPLSPLRGGCASGGEAERARVRGSLREAPRPQFQRTRTVAWSAVRDRICKDGSWNRHSSASTFRRIGWTFTCGLRTKPSRLRATATAWPRWSSVSARSIRVWWCWKPPAGSS